MFKLSEQLVFLIHARSRSDLVEAVGCLCGYLLYHRLEFGIDLGDPNLDVEAFVLGFSSIKSHADVQFEGFQHLGVLFCRFLYSAHNCVLDHAFLYGR